MYLRKDPEASVSWWEDTVSLPSSYLVFFQGLVKLTLRGRYINALEERIAFLEARLPAYAEDHFNSEPAERGTATNDIPEPVVTTPSRRGSCLSQGASVSDDVEGEEPSSLVEGVAYLSLCASGTTDTTPEPFYLGSSSGATVARMIQSSIFRSSGSRAISQAMAASQSQQPSVLRPSGGAAMSVGSDDSGSEFPFWHQAQRLFDVFFDRMHTRWPLLDRERYTQLFERQYEQGALSIIDRSIMHLIYAISARFLQLTRKPCGVDPEVYTPRSFPLCFFVPPANACAETSSCSHRADGLHPRTTQLGYRPVSLAPGRTRTEVAVRCRSLGTSPICYFRLH